MLTLTGKIAPNLKFLFVLKLNDKCDIDRYKPQPGSFFILKFNFVWKFNDHEDFISLTGFLIYFGPCHFLWTAKKQKRDPFSSTEANFIA